MALTVATAGTGVARTAHYVIPTGASAPIQTLLLEPQRTNLVVRSEDFSTTWATTASSIVSNAIIAPDGTLTADKLQTNTTSAEHSVTQTLTWTSGVTYGVSCYFKAGEIGYGFINLPTIPFSTIRRNYINLSTGAVTLAANTFGAAEALSNGWWRFTVWATATGSTLSVDLRIGLTTSDSTTTTTGSNTTDGIYIWGAQVETGVPSSYVKTEGTTVTRNADSLYFPFTVPPQAMTVYLRGVNVGAYQNQTNASRVLHIGDSATGTDPRFSLVRNAGASSVQALYDDGVTLRSGNATPSPTPVLRDIVEHRGVLSASWVPSTGISVNGGTEQTGTTTASGPATAWANPRLYIAGHADHDQFAYTHVAVVPGIQTMAEMRAIAGVS